MRAMVVWVLLAGTVVTGAVQAEVYKCKDADGRVVFSDHACTPAQTGAPVSGLPSASPKTPLSLDPGAALELAKRRQVHAGLSPECQALGDKAAQQLRSDAGLEDIKRAVSEFEGRCGDQVEKAWRATGQNRPAGKPDAAACRALRQVRDEAKARLGKMTDKEIMEYAKLHNEVSVACP